VRLDTGVEVTADFIRQVVGEELEKIRGLLGDGFNEKRFGQARTLFEQVALAPEFVEFLTIPAYELVD
jgi:malate synthase